VANYGRRVNPVETDCGFRKFGGHRKTGATVKLGLAYGSSWAARHNNSCGDPDTGSGGRGHDSEDQLRNPDAVGAVPLPLCVVSAREPHRCNCQFQPRRERPVGTRTRAFEHAHACRHSRCHVPLLVPGRTFHRFLCAR
jgi:hypothetical protein